MERTDHEFPQVIILPVVDNDSIVMVKVKRPVINDETLELPAGSAMKTGDFYVPAETYGVAETCHAAILHFWMDQINHETHETHGRCFFIYTNHERHGKKMKENRFFSCVSW